MNNPLVFMGGTCNGSTWRDALIEEFPNVNFFNPVVPNWNEEAYKKELEVREKCDICLYVITPKMTGVYSIAEVVDDSNKRPEKTVFCYLTEDKWDNAQGIGYIQDGNVVFVDHQIKSLIATGKLVRKNGGIWCENLDELKSLISTWTNT